MREQGLNDAPFTETTDVTSETLTTLGTDFAFCVLNGHKYGPVHSYPQDGTARPNLSFLFCPQCGDIIWPREPEETDAQPAG